MYNINPIKQKQAPTRTAIIYSLSHELKKKKKYFYNVKSIKNSPTIKLLLHSASLLALKKQKISFDW